MHFTYILEFSFLAIKESLEKDGTMNRLHGEIRAAVLSVLNKNFENYEPPKVPEETRIINELLREYLEWNGYLYTEQILSAGKNTIFGKHKL